MASLITQGNRSTLAKSCLQKEVLLFPSDEHTGQSKIQPCNERREIMMKLCKYLGGVVFFTSIITQENTVLVRTNA